MHKSARDELREWLARQNMTGVALAGRVGIQPPMISMLINGVRVPSLSVAARIEDVTGIPARSWVTRNV